MFLIAEMSLHFKVKASIANGHLPNMQDAPVVKMSPDASKPLNASSSEKQQKYQVRCYCLCLGFVGLLNCVRTQTDWTSSRIILKGSIRFFILSIDSNRQGGARAVDHPARSFDLAHPGVALPLHVWVVFGTHLLAKYCQCKQYMIYHTQTTRSKFWTTGSFDLVGPGVMSPLFVTETHISKVQRHDMTLNYFCILSCC